MQVTDNLRLLHNFLKKNIVEALIFYENKFLFQLHFLFAIVRKSTLLSKLRCTHKTNMKTIKGARGVGNCLFLRARGCGINLVLSIEIENSTLIKVLKELKFG